MTLILLFYLVLFTSIFENNYINKYPIIDYFADYLILSCCFPNGYYNSDFFFPSPLPANKFVARMPVERYASEYNMSHKHRGVALIFNHEFFDIPSLKSRTGTNVDAQELKKAFENLGFAVSVHKDCKLRDILKHVEKAAELDHTDNDCLAVAILSHGEHGYLYAKDTQYKLDNIWHYFTATFCPSLAGKPKLFFIQACQGDRLDGGITLEKGVTETDGESSTSYKIPIHADFLFSYSTIPGKEYD